jgi:hypothetical protein
VPDLNSVTRKLVVKKAGRITWELIVTDTDEFGGGVLECVKLQFTYTALG